ncbi:hypothetical protein [Streptomyces sp. NBC_01800]|uniref:hypothetical protein n=1 Tax=Streptomyces sp. NBC_01800 TaxID=2975945 RepID=UPI002DD7DC0F|nr:hypothetical protein [Streptomyces sp. NBC_01800]WSA65958.1 hypothetical protein OIE65_02465 [Streptomyces sp. NBC_01800]
MKSTKTGWIRRALTSTALAGAITVPLATPAHAAYDTADGCYVSIPFVECSTSPSIYPHSTQHWVLPRIWVYGTALCPVDWWIYDTYDGKRVRSGTVAINNYRSFTVYNLNASHRYQLILKSYTCTILKAELRNWT